MEIYKNEIDKDETLSPWKYSAEGAPGEDENTLEDNDAGYTEKETEFADGQGTLLEEEFAIPEKENLENDEDAFEEEED